MENKIVVHMKNGAIHKGVTHDFAPESESFYLLPAEGGGIPMSVVVDEMKALFYVKDYIGNRDFVARQLFAERAAGRKAIVTFEDDEKIWGTIPDGPGESGGGFFFYPSDPEDNNIRLFVPRSSCKELQFVD
jgi:hypothetical protein